MNPGKCTFGVKSRKQLGFVVSQKRIEVDPDKVEAILEMPKPCTEKQVHGFLGRLNYISKFLLFGGLDFCFQPNFVCKFW